MNKILYIYGYGSSPESSTYKWMEENFPYDEVHCIKYTQNDPKVAIDELVHYVKENDINILVGSSLGGWLTMHVAILTSKPSILINPLTDENIEYVLPKVTNNDELFVNKYLIYSQMHPLFKDCLTNLAEWDNFENGQYSIAIVGGNDKVIPNSNIGGHVYKTIFVSNAGHQLTDIEKDICFNEAYFQLLEQIDKVDNFYKKTDILP